MLTRTAMAAAALGVALLASGPANAGATMTLNNIATQNLAHKDCMFLARDVIREAGFRFLDETSEAVWGTANGGDDIVSIYCLTTANVAVFAAATPSGRGSVTSGLVTRMTDTWRRLR